MSTRSGIRALTLFVSRSRPSTGMIKIDRLSIYLSIYLPIRLNPRRGHLSILLYILTPEGDIRRVPGNQVLGLVSFLFFVSFCAMLVVLVVSERRASACLIMLSAKQGSHF